MRFFCKLNESSATQQVCLKETVRFVCEKKYPCFSKHSNRSEKFLTNGTATPQKTRTLTITSLMIYNQES